MDDFNNKIDDKIKIQVDHIFNIQNQEALKQKVYELAFEWYFKGFSTGVESSKVLDEK